jgi:hypothetical protein
MMNYNPNSDENQINLKTREFTNLTYDNCQLNQHQNQSEKPLKYYTTDFKKLVDDSKLNDFTFKNTDGQLLSGNSGQFDLKNDELRYKFKQQEKTCKDFGELPFPTIPFRGNLNFGNIDKENEIRFGDNGYTRKNSVKGKQNDYYNRSFSLFDDYDQVSLQVEPWNRAGVSTRYLQDDPKLRK